MNLTPLADLRRDARRTAGVHRDIERDPSTPMHQRQYMKKRRRERVESRLDARRRRKPRRKVSRWDSPVFERYLTAGTKIKWRGSDNIVYPATITADCVNGSRGSVLGYIERVVEIEREHEIIVVEGR